MKEYLDREREFTVNLMEKAWKWKCLSFATILAFFFINTEMFYVGIHQGFSDVFLSGK